MKEVVILVGPPGAGKTTYCKEHLARHERVSQDDLEGSREACRKRYKDLVTPDSGYDIVVDRCNFNREQRKYYVSLARENGFTVRMIVWKDCALDTLVSRVRARADHPNLDGSRCSTEKIVEIISFFLDAFRMPTPDEYDTLEVIECD